MKITESNSLSDALNSKDAHSGSPFTSLFFPWTVVIRTAEPEFYVWREAFPKNLEVGIREKELAGG